MHGENKILLWEQAFQMPGAQKGDLPRSEQTACRSEISHRSVYVIQRHKACDLSYSLCHAQSKYVQGEQWYQKNIATMQLHFWVNKQRLVFVHVLFLDSLRMNPFWPCLTLFAWPSPLCLSVSLSLAKTRIFRQYDTQSGRLLQILLLWNCFYQSTCRKSKVNPLFTKVVQAPKRPRRKVNDDLCWCSTTQNAEQIHLKIAADD